jgi:hypothetical protein
MRHVSVRHPVGTSVTGNPANRHELTTGGLSDGEATTTSELLRRQCSARFEAFRIYPAQPNLLDLLLHNFIMGVGQFLNLHAIVFFRILEANEVNRR